MLISYPDELKKIHEAYNEISREILDKLVSFGIADDASIEATIGDCLMRIMRENMFNEGESNV